MVNEENKIEETILLSTEGKNYSSILREISELYVKGRKLIRSRDNPEDLVSDEYTTLKKIYDHAREDLQAAYKKAETLGNLQLSLNPNAPICSWIKDKEAFLNSKLPESIQKRKTIAEDHIAILMRLENSPENKAYREAELNKLCDNISTQAGLKDLNRHNNELYALIKEKIHNLLDEMESDASSGYIKASKEMIPRMSYEDLKIYINQLLEQSSECQNTATVYVVVDEQKKDEKTHYKDNKWNAGLFGDFHFPENTLSISKKERILEATELQPYPTAKKPATVGR